MKAARIRVNTMSDENHMQMWHRLAQGMRHGAPGPRKGKGGKK